MRTSPQEHAEAIEVYRPEYNKNVVQQAVIDTRKSAPKATHRFLRAVVKATITAGLGAAAWGAWTNKLDTTFMRQLYQRINLSSAPNGLFWWGFGIATVAEVTASVSLFTWAWNKFDAQQEFTHAAPRRPAKRDYVMALPRAKASAMMVPNVVRSRVLDAKEWRPFKLVRKVVVSPNVYRLVFALPNHDDVLALPTGQHIALRANIGGQVVARSYTPVSNNSDLGRIELLIKVYDKGLMTKHLEGMQIGETIDIRGPKGSMQYSSTYSKHIGMIAGGTGITPMYQLIRAICADDSDNTQISLIYANNTEEDILLKDDLDGFALQCPHKFKVHYVLSKPSKDWTGDSGFVTADMIKKYLAPASNESKVLLCGPPPMINVMKKNLAAQGFKEPGALSKATDQVFLF